MIKLKPAPELKTILKERGITLQDICDQFGLHRTTVTRYINGEMSMSVGFLFTFAHWARINVYDLVMDEETGSGILPPYEIGQIRQTIARVKTLSGELQDTIRALDTEIKAL